MSDQRTQPSRTLLSLRAAIVVGMLLVATGAGGLLFGARQKVSAIDCLSGASPPSHWVYDQRGSERIRSLLGERRTLMFLDSPRELTFSDVFTAVQAQALHDLPTLRRVSIANSSPELQKQLRGLTNLEQLMIWSEVPPEGIAELHASMPNCDIIYWYWDGSKNTEFRFPGR